MIPQIIFVKYVAYLHIFFLTQKAKCVNDVLIVFESAKLKSVKIM